MTQYLPLRVGITVCALVVSILHILLPDLRIDSITVVLLIVSALPWVQPLVKSVELLGVKLELQELKNKIENAQGAASSAEMKAEYAAARQNRVHFSGAVNLAPAADEHEALSRLGDEYNRIRETCPSGADRTQTMTAVVGRMIDAAQKVQGFDVEASLKSDDGGRRLAAYACLYAKPDQELIGDLVASVTKQEDKPFAQYWGLQALTRTLAASDGRPLAEPIRRQLLAFASRIPRGSDRDYELRRILGCLDNAGGIG